MSRGRGYRDLLQLWPFFRPQLRLTLILITTSLLYAACDAGRVKLIEPLINRVLVRGGDARGEVEDELAARGASPAALEQELRAVAAPTPEEADGIRRHPRLEVRPIDDALPLAALLRRTDHALVAAADALAETRAEPPEWARLGVAARVQDRAVELAAQDPALAAALSLRARGQAHERTFGSVKESLLWIAFLSLVLALALTAGEYVTSFLARLITTRIFFDLQAQLAGHLLTLPLTFFDQARRGDLLTRLTADLYQLSILVSSLTSDLVIQVVRLGVLLAIALALSWQLTLVIAVLGLGFFWPLRLWARRLRRAARRRLAAASELLVAIEQVLSGARVIKAFQREDHEDVRFRGHAAEACAAQISAVRAREAAKTWTQAMNDVTLPLLFLGASYVVLARWWSLDAGALGVFLGLLLLMYLPARAVGEAFNHVQDSQPALERVFELFRHAPERPDAPDARPLDAVQELRFDAVSFGYFDDQPPTLRDVSFVAGRGTMTAIVGPTGSGKSTIMDLVAGLRAPTSGRVLVNGEDRPRFTRASYLDRLTVVPQTPFLFRGTVRENIRYGRLDATDAEVEEAARLAGLHEDIAALAAGYEHDVGERGANLSGGQVQRVALARALVRDADLILLDEGTSALDARTERVVQRALAALRERTITIVVAHRLSTILAADQILVVEAGRIVERGTHQELLAQGGAYARLWALQQLGDDQERASDQAPTSPSAQAGA